MRDTT